MTAYCCLRSMVSNLHLTIAICHAAGKPVQDVVRSAEETTALAARVRQWIARAIAICLQHRNSRATYTSMVWLWRSCCNINVSSEFKAALPGTYPKAFNFLAAEVGSKSDVYDTCSCCAFVYRGVFQHLEYCAHCCKERFHSHGTHRRAISWLIVCPFAEHIKYLWGHPDLARYVACTDREVHITCLTDLLAMLILHLHGSLAVPESICKCGYKWLCL